jgi:hypothetical protein
VRPSSLPNAPSQTSKPKQKCHPDRSEAQWRDLLFIIRSIESEWKRYPPLCHPDRSEAKWRDLQFRGPLLEMFFASGTICGAPLGFPEFLVNELAPTSSPR